MALRGWYPDRGGIRGRGMLSVDSGQMNRAAISHSTAKLHGMSGESHELAAKHSKPGSRTESFHTAASNHLYERADTATWAARQFVGSKAENIQVPGRKMSNTNNYGGSLN